MDKIQLWFQPGNRQEGAKWMSVYLGKNVRLCGQKNCGVCDLAVREGIRDFRGGKVEVILTLHRTPSFFAPEEYYLGHAVAVPTEEFVRAGADEGIETDYSILNAILVATPGCEILIDPGSAGFGEEEKAILRLVSGHKVQSGIVSHGHLDHWNNLGLLRGVPFYMSQITYELASRHAAFQKDSRLEQSLRLARKVMPGQTASFSNGNILVETFPFAHSIPEAMGLVIKGEKARFVHLGDFKFNGMEFQRKAETIATLQKIAEGGVDILAFNIINAHAEGFTPLEALVVDSLTDIMARAKGRVIIACFSSNLERIKRISEVARLLQRPVQFLGAGMQNAKELLGMDNDQGAGESVIFVTGCQAEENSVLWRVAKDQNPTFELEADDTVALSSRCIPGNEPVLKEEITSISPRVAEVVVNEGEKKQIGLEGSNIVESFIHVSGHGAKEDIRLALEILRPKQVLAWPQTSPQIEAFRKIAQGLGVEILPETERVIAI